MTKYRVTWQRFEEAPAPGSQFPPMGADMSTVTMSRDFDFVDDGWDFYQSCKPWEQATWEQVSSEPCPTT